MAGRMLLVTAQATTTRPKTIRNIRAVPNTRSRSISGMKVSSSPVSRPVGVEQEVLESRDAGLDREEVQHPPEEIRRTMHRDLGIEAHDDRVGVVPRVWLQRQTVGSRSTMKDAMV